MFDTGDDLDDLKRLVGNLRCNNSRNMKHNYLLLLPEDSPVKEILKIVYNPLKVFGIASTLVLNRLKLMDYKVGSRLLNSSQDSLLSLLVQLADAETSVESKVTMTAKFVSRNEKYQEIILACVDKNLKCGINTKMLREVWPDEVEEFQVALAKPYAFGLVTNWAEWYCSRKLDGIRCITTVNTETDEVKMMSRDGVELKTLKSMTNNIRSMVIRYNKGKKYTGTLVFDGELIVRQGAGESFSALQRQIHRKDHDIKFAEYQIFDCLFGHEFVTCQSLRKLSDRFEVLSKIIPGGEFDNIFILPQRKITDSSVLDELMLNTQNEEDRWEGLILRRDTTYKGKRSTDMLKVKNFLSGEFMVTGVRSSKQSHIVDGERKMIHTMASAVIDFKGTSVSVGSGWSLAQRQFYHKNPEQLIGKFITIEYFETTKNLKGGSSLRFPIFKGFPTTKHKIK